MQLIFLVEFLKSWRKNSTLGQWTDSVPLQLLILTRRHQFHSGNGCVLGFGVSFVAINPICNSPSLCFKHMDVGCLHGYVSKHNNSHIFSPFVMDSGPACRFQSSQRASRYQLSVISRSHKGLRWSAVNAGRGTVPQGRQLAARPLLTPAQEPVCGGWTVDSAPVTPKHRVFKNQGRNRR